MLANGPHPLVRLELARIGGAPASSNRKLRVIWITCGKADTTADQGSQAARRDPHEEQDPSGLRRDRRRPRV